MKTHHLLLFLGSLVTLSVNATENSIPDGLAKSDWASIREAYEAGRHAIRKQGDGTHIAHNPGQQWNTKFDGRGFLVRPKHGQWSWGMELVRCAGMELPVTPQVSYAENRVSYQWNANLEEWFLNDQRGVEQGWTIQSRPNSVNEDGFTLEFKVKGNLKPKISSNQCLVTFQNAKSQDQMTYGGLKAWDAENRDLEVRFVPGENDQNLVILVDDSRATYPITIDPVAQQTAYLKAPNTEKDLFGISVSISGNTAVVGAPREDSNGSSPEDNSAEDSGAVYVFIRDGEIWNQQAYLKAENAEANDRFGNSVSISGDTIAIIARGEDGNGSSPEDNSAENSGAVYVFTREGTTWSQQAYLKADDAEANDQLGNSISISGDTLAVGAEQKDRVGVVYIFSRNETTWAQQAILKADNAEIDDFFGRSVSIFDNTVAVGAIGEDSNVNSVGFGDNAGAAYVFTYNGMNWTQQAYLKANNPGLNDQFGRSISLSKDTLAIGAPGEDSDGSGPEDDNALNSGAVYMFVKEGEIWTQQAYLKASNVGANDRFGESISILDDLVIVGAPNENGNGSSMEDDSLGSAGAAYLFSWNGSLWSQKSYLKSRNPEDFDKFGHAVCASNYAAIIGEIGENPFSNDPSKGGGAYIYKLLIPPFSKFSEPISVFQSDPSYITAAFRLEDNNRTGVNIPIDIITEQKFFSIRENNADISPSESFIQVAKFEEANGIIRTVLLIDNSFSVAPNLTQIKEAAKLLVAQGTSNQEFAVYSFSGGPAVELQGFTQNVAQLQTAIDSIGIGSPTTNLYGAIIDVLPLWTDRFMIDEVERGFLIVLTDGSDQAAIQTLEQVEAERGNKQIYTIGLGDEIDLNALVRIGNAGNFPANTVDDLVPVFEQIQKEIENDANSFYWLNYVSPKRGNNDHTLQISISENPNTGECSVLNATFNSADFSDVSPEVVINRGIFTPTGESEIIVDSDGPQMLEAFTILGFVDSDYTWEIGDETIARLEEVSNSEYRLIALKEGMTTITVTDTPNEAIIGGTYVKAITVQITAGALGSSFPSILASSGLSGDDALPTADPNGDGIANGIAYALGIPLVGNVSSEARSRLPQGGVSSDTGLPGLMMMIPEDMPNDVTLCIERSSSLMSSSWTEIARKTGDEEWAGSAQVMEEESEEGFVPVMVAGTQNPETESKNFMRLRVEIAE